MDARSSIFARGKGDIAHLIYILIQKNTLLWTYPNLIDLYLLNLGVVFFLSEQKQGDLGGGSKRQAMYYMFCRSNRRRISFFIALYIVLKILNRILRLLNTSDSDCTSFLLSNVPRQSAKFLCLASLCRQSILFKNSNA